MFEIKLTFSYSSFDRVKDEWLIASSSLIDLGAKLHENYCYERKEVLILVDRFNKEKALYIIKRFLVKAYCEIEKRAFMEKELKRLYFISLTKKQPLLQAMTVFDRASDEKTLFESLQIKSEFSYDGFLLFRLNNLKKAWIECAELVKENACLLQNDSAALLFIRFLLSTARPKSKIVRICRTSKNLIIKSSFSRPKYFALSDYRSLINELIDVAPITIYTFGANCKEINELFEVKEVNDLRKCCKKLLLKG